MAIREVGGDRDPLPALGAESLRFRLELFDHQAVEQGRILEPTAIVMLEQVAHHDAAGRFVGIDADEPYPLVSDTDGSFGELAANVVRLLVVGARERFPDLLLPRMVVRHRERHQLLQGHTVLGVDVEELFGDGGKLQALLDDSGAHEEPGGDLLVGQPLLAQGLEGAKLVERVEGDALDVLGERILLGEAIGSDDARYELGLVYAPLLHEQLERSEAPAAGRHFENAGLLALGIQHRADAQALQERSPSNVFGEFLN